jgi:Metallo-beta-lactamase superfamily
MTTTETEPAIRGLHPTTAEPLPFAPELMIRAFLLERPQGNLLLYSTGSLEGDLDALRSRGGVSRQYLNHWHEAIFGLAPASLSARLIHHRAEVIPTPGHTAGATAYLWDNGDHRMLFTGDTIFLRDGEWVAAVVQGSDRERYIANLELIRELDYDLLVPWPASGGGPYAAAVDPAERRARIDAIIARLRGGGDH